MPDGKDNLLKLHTTLIKDGYDLPDFNTFKKDMSNPETLERLRTNLVNDKYELPDSATFATDMGLKKKVGAKTSGTTSQSTTEPLDTTSQVAIQSEQEYKKSLLNPHKTQADIQREKDWLKQKMFPQPDIKPILNKTAKPEAKEPEGTFWKEKGEALLQGTDWFMGSVANTPAFVLNVMNYGTNPLGDLVPMYEPNQLAEYYYNSMKARQADFDNKYDQSIALNIKDGNYKEAFSQIGNEVLKSAPLSVSLMMGNAAGLSAAGSIAITGTVAGAGQMMQLQKENPTMTPTEITGSSILNGLFEGVFEQWGITKLGGISKEILTKYGKEKGVKIIKEGFIQTYKPVVKKYGGVALEETLGEGATQFAQNAVTKYMGENPSIGLLDNVPDAMIIAVGASMPFTATPGTADVIMASKNRSKAQDLVVKKQNLEKDLENPNIPVSAKDVITDEIHNTDEAFSKIAKEDKAVFDALPEESQQKVGELIDTRTKLEQSLNNTELSEVGKKAVETSVDEVNKQIERETQNSYRANPQVQLSEESIETLDKIAKNEPVLNERLELLHSDIMDNYVRIEKTSELTPKESAPLLKSLKQAAFKTDAIRQKQEESGQFKADKKLIKDSKEDKVSTVSTEKVIPSEQAEKVPVAETTEVAPKAEVQGGATEVVDSKLQEQTLQKDVLDYQDKSGRKVGEIDNAESESLLKWTENASGYFANRVKEIMDKYLIFPISNLGKGFNISRAYEYAFLPKPTENTGIKKVYREYDEEKKFGEPVLYDKTIVDENGNIIDSRYKKYDTNYETSRENDSQHLFRGMSGQEFESSVKSRKFESNKSMNLGGQEEITSFAQHQQQAFSYAYGFAAWHDIPTFDKSRYVVRVKREGVNFKINEQGEAEVSGNVPLSNMVDVWEIRLSEAGIGKFEIKETFDGEIVEGGRSPGHMRTVVRKIEQSEIDLLKKDKQLKQQSNEKESEKGQRTEDQPKERAEEPTQEEGQEKEVTYSIPKKERKDKEFVYEEDSDGLYTYNGLHIVHRMNNMNDFWYISDYPFLEGYGEKGFKGVEAPLYSGSEERIKEISDDILDGKIKAQKPYSEKEVISQQEAPQETIKDKPIQSTIKEPAKRGEAKNVLKDKVAEIEQSLVDMRKDNPKEFKKDGTIKKGSKLEGSYKALMDMKEPEIPLDNVKLTPKQETKLKELKSELKKYKPESNRSKEIQAKIDMLQGKPEVTPVTKQDKVVEVTPTEAEVNIGKDAKVIADKFRNKFTIDSDVTLMTVPFAKEVWNNAVEVVAKIIEDGGTAAQGIVEGVKFIKQTDWYKGLSKDDKIDAENKFRDKLEEKETFEKTIEDEPVSEGMKERGAYKKIQENADISPEGKEGLKNSESARWYIPKNTEISNTEADAIIEAKGLDQTLKDVQDLKNDIHPQVRTILTQKLIRAYDNLGVQAFKEGKQQLAEDYWNDAEKAESVYAITGTKLGQELQAYNNFMSPERTLYKVRQEVKKQRDSRVKKKKKDIDKKIEDMREANEETINEVLEKVKPKTPVKRSVSKEKIDAEKEYRKQLKKEYPASELFTASFMGLNPKGVEYINKLAASYIREGFWRTSDIIIEIQKHFKKELGKDIDEKTIRTALNEKELEKIQEEGELEEGANRLATRIVGRMKPVKSGVIDPVKEMVDTLFKKVDEKLEAKEKGTPLTAIEKIRDAIIEKEKYAKIWEESKTEVEARINADTKLTDEQKQAYIEELNAYFDEIIGRPYALKEVSTAVRKGLRDLDVKLEQVVKDHYTVYDATKRTLVQKLMDDAGLSITEAEQLARDIQREFDRIATSKKTSLLKRALNIPEKAAPKRTRKLHEKIIELSNLGAFSNDEFIQMYADKMGFPKLTNEQTAKILELAENVQNAPEGFQKYEALQKLLTYQAKIPGIDWGEVSTAIWYANILSGYTTQQKNLVANTLNQIAELNVSAIYNPTALPYLLKGLREGYMVGVSEAYSVWKTGYSHLRGKVIDVPDVLNRWNFKGGMKNPANWYKYVFRFMGAADAFAYSGFREMRAYELAYMMANKGKGWHIAPSKEVYKAANEILYNTEERLAEATTQATEEGLKGNNRNRRIFELMEMSRPTHIIEQSNIFGSKGTFNHNTEGTIGLLTDLIGLATNSVAIPFTFRNKTFTARPLKFVAPFTRIIANVANTALDYSLIVGTIRGIKGGIGFKPMESTRVGNKYREYTPEERTKQFIKVGMGLVAQAMLFALSEPDDEGNAPIEISGAGTGDYKKDNQLKDTGWQPYSIKIGKNWWSYKLTPLVLALAPIGMFRDNQKYKKDTGENALMKLAIMQVTSMKVVSDMTAFGSVAGALDAVSSVNERDLEKYLKRTSESTAKGFIKPNLYSQLYKKYLDIQGMPQKETEGLFANLVSDIPFARDKYKDAINALGEPVVKRVDIFVSEEKTGTVWNYIVENNAFISVPAKNSEETMIYDAGLVGERPMNDQEYYDFIKERGSIIKSEIELLMKETDLTREEIKSRIKEIQSKSTTDAKLNVFN